MEPPAFQAAIFESESVTATAERGIELKRFLQNFFGLIKDGADAILLLVGRSGSWPRLSLIARRCVRWFISTGCGRIGCWLARRVSASSCCG